MPNAREILFRIFYSTSFTIVFLVLIAFICISPADALYFSYRRRRLIDIFLIAGVYIVTALIAILLYASRLYTTRSILKEIPKTFVPVDKDDLPGKKTWRLIADTLKRSAVIAQQARPRAYRIEDEVEGAEARIENLLRPDTRRNGEESVVPKRWGTISHPGWSSPADVEMPDLQYADVVAELMDLIEAKAVSLAPVDPMATPGEDGNLVPDERVIEALTRPDVVGMRRYMGLLIEMGVVEGSDLTTAFLTLYERARFAVEPLSEAEFRNLMRLFAEVLRSMKQPTFDAVDFESSHADEDGMDRGSIDRKSVRSLQSSSASSISGSVRHYSITPRKGSRDSVRVASRGVG